ncbi:MAG: septum formation initiator family protein [Patescibacteria group bacterium]|nr:septum formation initiator family protein [Patescibacteria group bacterium]
MNFLKKIFFLFLSFFLIFSLLKNIINHQKKLQFYQEYEEQLKKERKKNIELKTEIARKNDLYYVEKIARNKLNLSKENEMVIILSPPSPTPTIITPTPAPNWYLWFKVFFN